MFDSASPITIGVLIAFTSYVSRFWAPIKPHVGQEHKGHDKEQVAQIGDGIDDTVGEQIA